MKTELKLKFLQYLNKKKQDEGFTLIELLVVIIIIGILAAIALPSFLNQANKAKQAEAKEYIGSMNRAQQAFYLEKGFFADQPNFGNLGLGIATQTVNYVYTIADGGSTPVNSQVTNQAEPALAVGGSTTSVPLKGYVGGVVLGTVQGTGEATTLAILCEGQSAIVQGGPYGTDKVASVAAGVAPSCPAKYSDLGKGG